MESVLSEFHQLFQLLKVAPTEPLQTLEQLRDHLELVIDSSQAGVPLVPPAPRQQLRPQSLPAPSAQQQSLQPSLQQQSAKLAPPEQGAAPSSALWSGATTTLQRLFDSLFFDELLQSGYGPQSADDMDLGVIVALVRSVHWGDPIWEVVDAERQPERSASQFDWARDWVWVGGYVAHQLIYRWSARSRRLTCYDGNQEQRLVFGVPPELEQQVERELRELPRTGGAHNQRDCWAEWRRLASDEKSRETGQEPSQETLPAPPTGAALWTQCQVSGSCKLFSAMFYLLHVAAERHGAWGHGTWGHGAQSAFSVDRWWNEFRSAALAHYLRVCEESAALTYRTKVFLRYLLMDPDQASTYWYRATEGERARVRLLLERWPTAPVPPPRSHEDGEEPPAEPADENDDDDDEEEPEPAGSPPASRFGWRARDEGPVTTDAAVSVCRALQQVAEAAVGALAIADPVLNEPLDRLLTLLTEGQITGEFDCPRLWFWSSRDRKSVV